MSDEDFDALFRKLVDAQRMHDEHEAYEQYLSFDSAILEWLKQHPEVKVVHTVSSGRMVTVPEHMMTSLLSVVGTTTEFISALMHSQEIDGFLVDMELMQRVSFIAAIITRRFIVDDEKAKEN